MNVLLKVLYGAFGVTCLAYAGLMFWNAAHVDETDF